MKPSLRARRMARNHQRMARPARLNLVALMDIFTILVLFLMVNNGDVEVLQPDRDITLPESISEQRPELALTIKVGAGGILVDEREISTVQQALALEEDSVPALQQELAQQAALAPAMEPEQAATGRPVIIMADSGMPYKLLKRIMATCAASDYRDISLAVNSAPQPPPGGDQFAAREG